MAPLAPGSCGLAAIMVPSRPGKAEPLRMSTQWRSCRSPALPWDGPGLARGSGAGFLVRWRLPGNAGAYAASAGVLALRPTGGEVEQVTGGVHIPVDEEAARLARVLPLGQGQLGFHRAAA